MFAPARQVGDADRRRRRIPEIVAHAVDVATTGRPGPVVIALSEEMQKDMVDVPDLGPAAVARPQPDPAAMSRLPALLAGAASRWRSWAAAAGRRPGGRRSTLPDRARHPRRGRLPAAGAVRRHAAQLRRRPRRRARPGAGGPWRGRRPGAGDRHPAGRGGDPGLHAVRPGGQPAIVHVHQDAAEIGRVFRPRLGIAADLNAFAAAAAALPARDRPGRTGRPSLRATREAGREPPDYPAR